jgi:aldose 1-epimerase
MNLDKEQFKEWVKGKQTGLYYLQNDRGLTVAITNYGARIVALWFPDSKGEPVDVVTGFDSMKNYLASSEPYHGAIIGRFANRIAQGRFPLKGKEYQLFINNPPNHLHGGPQGFHNQVWEVKKEGSTALTLSYISPDGEEHYPGNLTVGLTYTVTDANELLIGYTARTDASTIINLTSHPFFNLNGQGTGPVYDHLLQVDADEYTLVNDQLIPTGIAPVEGTPFDFRETRSIGERIDNEDDQLVFGSGYDHNFVLKGKGMRKVAMATGDQTQIMMEVHTDQPGMQLYSGNFMKGENNVKYGLKDGYRFAFCLETQHFPDAPNHPGFPSTVLEPGDVFQSRTIYKFSTAQ